MGFRKLRYERGCNCVSLANAVGGRPVSYEFAKNVAQNLNRDVESLFNIKHTKEPYAYETINKVKRTVRAILSTAKKQRIIMDNYASADYITFPKKPSRYTPCATQT